MAGDKDKPKEKAKDKEEKKKQEDDAEAGDDDGKGSKESKPKYRIHEGDYVVRVNLIEGRELKGRDFGGTSDPVCTAEIMNQKKTSKIHKKAFNVQFDEVLVFEFKKLEVAEVESAKVRLSVYDANAIRRNVLIGAFEFDLAAIYYREHHEIFRQWIALSDITDATEGIQGYLKLSIVVLGPGDEQHVHTAEEEDDEDEGMLSVLMPPAIQQKGYLLRVQVYEFDGLPQMDQGLFGGRCDPYAKVEFASVVVKGKHVTGQNNVQYLYELQVPVMEPAMSNVIRFSVYDWDAALSDDRIATFNLDYAEIKAQRLTPRWFNLYGAPEGKQSGVADKMNKGFIKGSFYRGRVLLSADVEEQEDPKADTVVCNGVHPSEMQEEEKYMIRFDLYEGSEIPDKGSMYVEVACGHRYFRSEAVPVEEARCRWYEVVKDNGNDMVVQFPKDTSQVPDVYVYMCSNGKRISYLSFSMLELVEEGWKTSPTWHILKEDRSLDLLDGKKGEFPGILLFSLMAGSAKDAPAQPFPESRPMSEISQRISQVPAVSGQSEAELAAQGIPTVGTLTLRVIEGRNLPPSEGDSCDPYIKVKIGRTSFKTKYIKKSVNPVWNDEFKFENVSIASILKIKVLDHDIGTRDDILGKATIDLRTQQSASSSRPGHDFVTDNWFLISDRYPNAAVRLRFHFKYLPLAQAMAIQGYTKKSKDKAGLFASLKKPFTRDKRKTKNEALGEPEVAQYQLRVHLYQARGLPAADASGVSDPYIVVRLQGKKLQSDTKFSTVNPIWYTSYAMNVELPVPLTLAPQIQCYVFDFDKYGKDDALGRFSLSVTEALTMNPSTAQLTPKWFDLRDWDDNEVPGAKVLISFQLLDPIDAGSPLPDIRPPTVPLFLELTTLGLRSMSSTLGVYKTYIKYIMPSGKPYKTNVSNRPSPSNPNFLQIMKLPVNLPIDRLYAPPVDIEVKDVLFGGLVKRLLGTASLDLADFMKPSSDGAAVPLETKIEVLDEKELEQEMRDERELELRERARKALSDAMHKAESDRLEVEADDEDKRPLMMASRSSEVEMGRGLGALEGDDDEKRPLKEHKIDIKEAEFDEGKGEILNLDEPPKDGPEDEDKPEYMKGRAVVDNELEDVMTIRPFHMIRLFTGQRNAGIFGKKYREIGQWKGLVRLASDKNESPAFDPKELLQPQDLYVRLYILRGTGLMSADPDGSSDPYLKIKLGKHRYSTRDRYIKNSLEPGFFESFEIPCQIPGDAHLEIAVWDWDGIGDDLIGSTVIDVEDRWFCKQWRKLAKKPLEIRTLHSPTSSVSQGKLELWVEILTTTDAKTIPMIDIKPPPPEPYELRVIIWGCRDVPNNDTTTDANDMYVTGHVSAPGIKKQRTDTHLRARKGKGNFNWRMKFPLMLPQKPWPRLRLAVWDKDFFSANDSICETVIGLKGLCKQAMKKKDSTKILVKGDEKFWLEKMGHPNEPGVDMGRMQISVELLPESVASQLPAGFGRSDPNMNPYLPPPEGRIKFMSWLNPLNMLRDLLGDRLYRKICCIICCALLLISCYFIFPLILSNFLSSLLANLFT